MGRVLVYFSFSRQRAASKELLSQIDSLTAFDPEGFKKFPEQVVERWGASSNQVSTRNAEPLGNGFLLVQTDGRLKAFSGSGSLLPL